MSDRVVFLAIEPTPRCNFSCCFCAGRHMPQPDMTLATFDRILASCSSVRRAYTCTARASPLLNPDFFTMVERLRASHPAAGVFTVTNGSLLSANHAERIVDFVPPSRSCLDRIGQPEGLSGTKPVLGGSDNGPLPWGPRPRQ